MGDGFLSDLVTKFGPLGIGWVAFFIMLRAYFSLVNDHLKSSTDIAAAISLLSERIRTGANKG